MRHHSGCFVPEVLSVGGKAAVLILLSSRGASTPICSTECCMRGASTAAQVNREMHSLTKSKLVRIHVVLSVSVSIHVLLASAVQ